MHLINKGLSIVYNGEIYNYKNLRKKLEKLGHKFETKSDTEVILLSYVEWGVDCINYFNGMFAFSIYDSNQKKLFIARDRTGQKPIFYHYENDTIYF